MTRTEIRGLKWARLGPRPHYIQQKRQRGAKAKGLAFERKVGKLLKRDWPAASLGQWIYFEDARGAGVAQPDILILDGSHLHIIECKLTWRPDVEAKLRAVYGVLLRYIYPTTISHYTQVFHNFGQCESEAATINELFLGRTPDDYVLINH